MVCCKYWLCRAAQKEQAFVYSEQQWVWQPAALLAWQQCMCDNCHYQEVDMEVWLCKFPTCLFLVGNSWRKVSGGEKMTLLIVFIKVIAVHGYIMAATKISLCTGIAQVLLQNIWAPVCDLLLKSLRRRIKITNDLGHIWSGWDPFVVLYCLRD